MKRNYRAASLSGSQIGLIVLNVILVLILIALVFVTAYVNHIQSLLNYETHGSSGTLSSSQIASIESQLTETFPSNYTGTIVDPTDISIPDDTPDTIIRHEKLVNILLIGQDRRPGEGRQRSDSMILCTFNIQDHTITLTSFMRDMYVDIPGYRMNKINAAYQRGGMPMLCETLMLNFGVYVDGCVEVDFTSFSSIIDMLGGIEIELTNAEALLLNEQSGYVWELTGGTNVLNGAQALDYARIRKIGNDFARTERQRKVLTQVISEFKGSSLSELMDVMETFLPMITTDLSFNQITNYLINLFPILADSTIETLRIPANGTYEDVAISGVGESLVPDLAENRQILIDKLLPNN